MFLEVSVVTYYSCSSKSNQQLNFNSIICEKQWLVPSPQLLMGDPITADMPAWPRVADEGGICKEPTAEELFGGGGGTDYWECDSSNGVVKLLQ